MKYTKYTTIPLVAALLAGVGVNTASPKSELVKAAENNSGGQSNKGMEMPPAGNPPQKPNEKMGNGGPNTQNYDYTGTREGSVNVKSGSKTIGKKTISNSKTDQNTVLVQNSGKLMLDGTSLKKTGDSTSDDNANFYGLDSVILANGKNCRCYSKKCQSYVKCYRSEWDFCNK